MERASIDGVTVEYEVVGQGEPLVFIHGAFIADSFRPLLADARLVGKYRLITYHRRGYAGSSPANHCMSVGWQAADCRALLQHLGIVRAHVVGHSWGGCFALQLALDAPEVVRSLVVLEPGLMVGASGEAYRASLLRAQQRYRVAGPAPVLDAFMEARWPGYRPTLDRLVPGAFDQAVEDAGTALGADLGLLDWQFGENQARRVTQPVLVVLGGDSGHLDPRFVETHRFLLEWLPNAQGAVLPGTTHFMQLQKPDETAGALADFLRRYPVEA